MVRPCTGSILIMLLLSAACGGGDGRQVSEGPPSIILISVDALRADRLNCYGFGEHRVSPNIDALAGDGVLFEQHIAASPWTTPSHMSMLTGLYPSAHGIIDPFDADRASYPCLADERRTVTEVLAGAGLRTGAFTGGITLDPALGFGQGFQTYTTDMYKLNEQNMAGMLDWLSQGAQPLFLFWHTFEVHAPYLETTLLPAEHDGMRDAYEALAEQLRSFSSHKAHLDHSDDARRFLAAHGAYTKEVCERLYLGGIRSLDARLGELVARLRELGLYDSSLIIFTSDHGDELADHDPTLYYDSHGHTMFEEIIRVPLIIKLPRQRLAGHRITQVTSAVDLMPTMLDAAGLAGQAEAGQGSSLLPLLAGEEPRSRVVFSEAVTRPYELKCARSTRHKYVLHVEPEQVAAHGRSFLPDDPGRQLFALEHDPGEHHDLLTEPLPPPELEVLLDLELRLRRLVGTGSGPVGTMTLDEQDKASLRALGYIE